jgi:(R,R)-butanediol dehydrogenase / meso-butanediol dehydrogenase / diacetyl reductase
VLAAVYHGRRDVRVEEVTEPTEPGPGEVLLEVSRAAICGTDAGEWAHGPRLIPPFGDPVVLGHEFVGRVVRAGDGVDLLAPGDRVVSGAGVSCGECEWCRLGRTNLCESYYTLGFQADGGLAETVVTPASICHRVPDACHDDAAAIAQPLAVAIHALERAGLIAGDEVCVIGVGGIGAQLVAAAGGLGAKVIAVDVDRSRLRTAAALGAKEVVDASKEDDPAAVVVEASRGAGVPIVIESSGAPAGLETALGAVRRGGTVVLVGMPAAPPRIDVVDAILREVNLVTSVAHVCDTDIPQALGLLTRGEIADHVIDSVIPLSSLVKDGLMPVAEGRAEGKIVIEPPS